MAFKMAQGSLFAVLLRSQWWYSVLIGLVFIAVSLVLAGGQYVILGIFTALPFFAIAAFSAYKQSQQPSQKRILEVAQQAKKMPAAEIAERISRGYVDARFDAVAFEGNAADLELSRGNRKILVCSKRSKVANTGIEPLKKLVAAGEKIEATEYLYVALGEISAAAREFAKQNSIEFIQADSLAAYFDGKASID